jgi:translation initiation factor 5A
VIGHHPPHPLSLQVDVQLYKMADDFQTTDSGASLTTPEEASALRKGGFVCIKGFPCKISDISKSKTGKHGSAKIATVGIDIFTGAW